MHIRLPNPRLRNRRGRPDAECGRGDNSQTDDTALDCPFVPCESALTSHRTHPPPVIAVTKWRKSPTREQLASAKRAPARKPGGAGQGLALVPHHVRKRPQRVGQRIARIRRPIIRLCELLHIRTVKNMPALSCQDGDENASHRMDRPRRPGRAWPALVGCRDVQIGPPAQRGNQLGLDAVRQSGYGPAGCAEPTAGHPTEGVAKQKPRVGAGLVGRH